MWAIGRPQAILSLSGHQSPVESVTFDPQVIVIVIVIMIMIVIVIVIMIVI